MGDLIRAYGMSLQISEKEMIERVEIIRNGTNAFYVSDVVSLGKPSFGGMKVFKTKSVLNRVVTVCVNVSDNRVITAGYSVAHPDDDFNDDIAKKISLGRADKDKTNILDPMFLGEGMEQKYILYAIADRVFRDIENGKIQIKGIK